MSYISENSKWTYIDRENTFNYFGWPIWSCRFDFDGWMNSRHAGTVSLVVFDKHAEIGIDNLYHSGSRSVTVQNDDFELIVDVVVSKSFSFDWLINGSEIDALIGLFSWKIVVANELLRIGGWTFLNNKKKKKIQNYVFKRFIRTRRCRCDRRLIVELLIFFRVLATNDVAGLVSIVVDEDDSDDDESILVSVIGMARVRFCFSITDFAN